MKTLSIEEQLELISPQEISLTESEIKTLNFKSRIYNAEKATGFKAYVHPLRPTNVDLLDKAKSFADMIGHDKNDDNLLVWFYDLYQAQQAQKQI